MSAFETLRDQVDLVELAQRCTEMQQSGKAYVGRCPHPDHEDRNPSFYIYPDRRFYCYGCGRHGDVTDFWAVINNVEPGFKAARDLARERRIELPGACLEARRLTEERRQREAEYLESAKRSHEALARHPDVTQWWERRGFDERLRKQFLLGAGAGEEATVPFWYKGRAQGLIRRKLKGEPKYQLPKKEEFPTGCRPLFIPGSIKGEIFLVEGYLDALALAALGYGGVAVGGTHPNQSQTEELKRLHGPVYILPDADEEGKKAAQTWARELYPEAFLCPSNYKKEENHDD